MQMMGHLIKQYRKDKSYTQQQLADLLGVKLSTVANWEVNRTQPELDSFVKLGDILDVSLDDLVGRNFSYKV